MCVPEPLVQDPVRELQQEQQRMGAALLMPRAARSNAWEFYHEVVEAGVSCVKCKLCNKRPSNGMGTSGIWGHLKACHPREYAHARRNSKMSMKNCIAESLAACTDKTKDALAQDESSQLHRLAALWIAKCGRSQQIVDDPELQMLISSTLQKCRSKFRFILPCRQTLNHHISQLGADGTYNSIKRRNTTEKKMAPKKMETNP